MAESLYRELSPTNPAELVAVLSYTGIPPPKVIKSGGETFKIRYSATKGGPPSDQSGKQAKQKGPPRINETAL